MHQSTTPYVWAAGLGVLNLSSGAPKWPLGLGVPGNAPPPPTHTHQVVGEPQQATEVGCASVA